MNINALISRCVINLYVEYEGWTFNHVFLGTVFIKIIVYIWGVVPTWLYRTFLTTWLLPWKVSLSQICIPPTLSTTQPVWSTECKRFPKEYLCYDATFLPPCFPSSQCASFRNLICSWICKRHKCLWCLLFSALSQQTLWEVTNTAALPGCRIQFLPPACHVTLTPPH